MSRIRARCSSLAAAYLAPISSTSRRTFIWSGDQGWLAGAGFCARAAPPAARTARTARTRALRRMRRLLLALDGAELVLDLRLLVRVIELQPLRVLLRQLLLRPGDVEQPDVGADADLVELLRHRVERA